MSNIKREWLGDRNLVRDLTYVFAQLSLLNFKGAEEREWPQRLTIQEKREIRKQLRRDLKRSLESCLTGRESS